MTSRPAYDEITLALGTDTVRLRPSLRAAAHFVRLDGFADLPRRITEFNLGAIRDLITVAATDRQEASAFLAAAESKPLLTFADAVTVPMLALVAGFVPASDDDAKPDAKAQAKPMPWPKVYRELFRTATGWLGWTPEAAWDATPTEINEAVAGLYDKLKATHGAPDKDADQKPDAYGADQLRQIEEQGFDPAFDRDGLRKLKVSLAGGKR
ncbi:hypothetical protein FJ959_07325 [Mesorhizobium sp. B2-2-4]|uniref:hypothetical protein n=1 Tax=unclassified Mesorhizobium TaxID=325217 RepID=UPI00112B3463|nr:MULTISPECIES: hypothetical protein [unclassified Mesorhizobium]TPM61097.1 hypothetical protein FJ959_07325 [Mesorhizobium sp. B2-2-4]TPM70529.1 hypothetical protein FJ965_01795 [Mesorhizobium sp. B2-2-1]TPN70381.1 hypothetical protein FJ984_07775 [Mesorhizobium sp. B1-1-3]